MIPKRLIFLHMYYTVLQRDNQMEFTLYILFSIFTSVCHLQRNWPSYRYSPPHYFKTPLPFVRQSKEYLHHVMERHNKRELVRQGPMMEGIRIKNIVLGFGRSDKPGKWQGREQLFHMIKIQYK